MDTTNPKRPADPEPWLRGPLAGVPPLVQPLFFSFMQVREELAHHTTGLTDPQVWRRTAGVAPLGFHLRHIAGSVDRLLTYLEDRQLSEARMAALRLEGERDIGLAALLREVDHALSAAEQRLLQLDLTSLDAPRYVGRRRLPSTVVGLLVHIAEHTQRHLGQAIIAAKLARAASD